MNINHLAFLIFFLCFSACNHAVELPAADILAVTQKQKCTPAEAENIVFQSADGGQTWQDISSGLPKNLQAEGLFAKDGALYLRAGNSLFYSKPNCNSSSWKKETSLNGYSAITAGSGRILGCNDDGQFLQKTNGAAALLPIPADFKEKAVRTIFETAEGNIFIGCDDGIFKSVNSGKTWKQLHHNGWVMKFAEQDGVLIATSQQGILRSTNDGERWDLAVSEGGAGIAAECINGGFAVITYNTESKTRRIRTSEDNGKSWQIIDADLQARSALASKFPGSNIAQSNDTGIQPEASITSIIQVENYFYRGHPAGIFRSADKGKTWKLILPSIGNKVFSLYVSDKVIYAIPINGGC